jgi:hypothetical protein
MTRLMRFANYAERAAERQAGEARARAILGGVRTTTGSAPCVVKNIVPGSRSVRGTKALVRYIARVDSAEEENPGRPVALRDEMGTVVLPADLSDAARLRLTGELVDSWGLKADADNLNELAAGRSRTAGREDGLGRDGRLDHVQAVHLVLTAPVRAPRDRVMIEEAAGAAIQRTFGRWGFKVLWGAHDSQTPAAAGHPRKRHEHSYLHIHAVVKRRRERVFSHETPTLLRQTPDGLLVDTLRLTFAESCRSMGVEVEGLRREDRADVVEAVLRGDERLRRGWTRGRAEPRPQVSLFPGETADDRTAGQGTLVRLGAAAPGWAAAEGMGAATRLLALRTKAERQVPDDDAGPTRLRRFSDVTQALFVDAEEAALAAQRFRRLIEEMAARREETELAVWVLLRRPNIFGRAKEQATWSEGQKAQAKRAIEEEVSVMATAARIDGPVPDGPPLGPMQIRQIANQLRMAETILGVAADRETIVASWRTLARKLRELDGDAKLADGLERKAAGLAAETIKFGALNIPAMTKSLDPVAQKPSVPSAAPVERGVTSKGRRRTNRQQGVDR